MEAGAIYSDKLRLDLIGPFGLFAPNGDRIDVRSRKSVAMLALLAFAPNGLRTRAWLQAMLWGSRAPEQAQSSLRRELSTLCGLLAVSGHGDVLVRESQRVHLRLDRLAIDVDILATTPHGRTEPLRGTLLEGIDLADCSEFENWLQFQRERTADLLRYSVPVPDRPLFDAATVLGGALPSTASLIGAAAPPIPPKPSVAVLPFLLAKGADLPFWLGESLAEDISNSLTQFPQLFVVAAAAAAVLSERDKTPVEIASALGVRYLLAGSVRPTPMGLKTTAQLLDGQSGQQIWAKQFENAVADLPLLSEKVTVAVAPQIWTNIDLAERHRSAAMPAARASSYDLYWRANAIFRNWTRESGLEAIQLTEELVGINPACPLSAGLAAFCHGVAFAFDWTHDQAATRRAAIHHYQNAVRLGGSNVETLGHAAGTLIAIGGDLEQADRLIAHALALLPAYQPTLFWGGWVDLSQGRFGRARERFELSLRINPISSVRSYALTGIGISLLLENDSTALPILKEAAIELHSFPPTLAALAIAASANGDGDTARNAAGQLRQLGGVDAALSIVRNAEHRKILTAVLASVSAS